MLLLTTTSTKLRLVTDAAASVDVHASWVDRTASTDTPGYTNTSAIATATTTDIVPVPAASTVRNVRLLTITNTSATSVNVQVQHYDGTAIRLATALLKTGHTLSYNDTAGWTKTDASGGRVETPLQGRYLGTSVLTSASANFTTGPETNTIVIRGVAGGGGGGGCTSVAAACSAGGGGGAGGYAEKTFTVTPNTAYAYTCGALGAGSSGALGGTGGNSTFVVGATTVTANGGVGAPVATAATTLKAYPGGAGGAVSTNGDVNGGGQPGEQGVVLIVNAGTTEIQVSGDGGSTIFGGGGVGLNTSGAGAVGNNATGFGAGGGGAVTGAAQARAGGNGTAGCWIVDEYS